MENLQYSQGGPLTVTIPETAESGEWELRLLRYNESRGSWTVASAGLPDAFVSQGWQPGQQATVDAETMSGSDWKMEAKNTVLGGWVQFRLGDSDAELTPTPSGVTADQQARADAAEQLYEDWVNSQAALSPTPTPMPIETLGGEGYPAGRVRAQGSRELDGRTQDLVALQIQPPEDVTLAEDEIYLQLYYRDSQAANPEFVKAFAGKVSVYQNFSIDYRDEEGQLVTHTTPEDAVSMDLLICLNSDANSSTSGKWRYYWVDKNGISTSGA